jgi:acetyl-CoA C-acetyltransferase
MTMNPSSSVRCTPVGKRGGRLQKWHPVDLMAETLRQLVERSGINPADLDDVIVGCVLQWDQQHGNLAGMPCWRRGCPNPSRR